MIKEFNHVSLEEMHPIVAGIFEWGGDLPVWTFTGDLGTGKTTLIKALAHKLGIRDVISSPTFNYVNDYDGELYHFDCYRLENVREALNLGLEEYLDSGKRCWVEWPEVIAPILPVPHLQITLSHNRDNTRNYTISKTNF